MEKIERKYVNWDRTGKNLEFLRCDNLNLRRNVCNLLNYDKGLCSGECEICRYEMDNSISRSELATVFNVSESVVFNWENNRTHISIEDLLFYCQLASVGIDDILVYE